jgi:hypothetical protein
MRAGPECCDFPALRTGAPSGAGDEEVFETKASPPAVAGPLFALFVPFAYPRAIVSGTR